MGLKPLLASKGSTVINADGYYGCLHDGRRVLELNAVK